MSSAARLILHTCTLRNAYDGIHCVADLALDGTLLRSYTWGTGIDNLLAVTLYGGDSTNTLYAVTDPLGTVHALVGTNGVPAVTYAYDSWGNLLSVSGDETLASLRFTWQGREYSRATALYSFRARWYDPASGRWLSKDPIGLEGGLNLYEAFGSNPVCFGDPDGLQLRVIETFKNHIRERIKQLKYIHHNVRDNLNHDLPLTPEEAKSEGWKRLPPSQSIYHDNKRGKPEMKFIHKDGREVVYDGDTKEIVTDPKLKGTFNFTNPMSWDEVHSFEDFKKFSKDGVSHVMQDVIPYLIWGNE